MGLTDFKLVRAAVLAAVVAACGTQFTDPILGEAALETAGAPGASGSGGASEPPCATTWAARFGGNAFAAAPRLVQDDFTIEAWILPSTSPQGTGFHEGSALAFADVEKIEANDFAMGLLNDKFFLTIGGPDTTTFSSSAVTTGSWVHVAAVRSMQTGVALVFVNGVLEGSNSVNAQALADEPTLHIGGRPDRNFYTGLMSELRIWEVARSQADIVSHLHQRLTGTEPGLIGYYRLDEQGGQLAHDWSRVPHDAEFTGAIAWEPTDLRLCNPR